MHLKDRVSLSGSFRTRESDSYGHGSSFEHDVGRMRAPPATTAPLDDDFDAYTLDTNWFPKRISTDMSIYKMPSHSSLGDGSRDPRRSITSFLPSDNKDLCRDEDDIRVPYGEEVQRIAGQEIDLDVQMKRLEVSKYRLGKFMEPVLSATYEKPITPQAVRTNGLSRKPHSASRANLTTPKTLVRRGSASLKKVDLDYHNGNTRPGFAMVEQKVLEDGPERTVTVWREEVARKVSRVDGNRHIGGDVEMSVYYQGFNGGLDVDLDGSVNETDSYGRRIRTPSQHSQMGGLITTAPRNQGAHWKGTNTRHHKHLSSELHKEQMSPSRISMLKDTPTAPAENDRHIMKSFAEPLSPRGSSIRGMSLSPAPASALPKFQSTPIASSASGSPTTLTNFETETRDKGNYNTLQTWLSTTQPPLTHLYTQLVSLGMRTEEHLRAVSRMRSGSRGERDEGYQEVRQEALSKGVTVVEWAILMGSVSG